MILPFCFLFNLISLILATRSGKPSIVVARQLRAYRIISLGAKIREMNERTGEVMIMSAVC
jgi:predicted membrane protein